MAWSQPHTPFTRLLATGAAGLPGLYALSASRWDGWIGWLLGCIFRPYLIAVTGNFGFLPGSGQESPAAMRRLVSYRRGVINGWPSRVHVGYVSLYRMIRTSTLPRWSGILVAVGAPAHLLGFGLAQLVSTAAGRSPSWARESCSGLAGPAMDVARTSHLGSLVFNKDMRV